MIRSSLIIGNSAFPLPQLRSRKRWIATNSGFPTDRFCFEGFLPPKKGRLKRIEAIADEKRTTIFYESPHRLLKTLTQLEEVLGSARKASISREISKLHEETIRGTLEELKEHFTENKPKGEFVLIIQGIE